MYTGTELKKALFSKIRLRRSDFSFAKGDQYAVLRLKQSKTDTKHTGVQIVLTTIGKITCSIATLAQLYTLNPHPANSPLF